MSNITIRIPEEMLPNIIGMLSDKVAVLGLELKDVREHNNLAQYKIAELKNQIESLKEENKKLREEQEDF